MKEQERIKTMVEDLSEFAMNREDIKWIACSTPESAGLNINTLEYELQLLKIVAVGWSISYYLQEEQEKDLVLEPFWKNIHELSHTLNQTTSLLIGVEINYFQTLKSRLDEYVQSMANASGGNPTEAIGQKFAEHFKDSENLFAYMAGSKMFMTAARGVREYLIAAGYEIKQQPENRNFS